jgi:hypothetical protein
MMHELKKRSLALCSEEEQWVFSAHDMAPRGCFKGGGGGGGTQQVVQKSDPWAGQQDYLTEIFQRAQKQSLVPQKFFPGQTFAGLSPETEAALQLQTQRALQGSPLTAAAQNELTRTLSGEYLRSGNPHLGAMMGRVADEVAPRLNAQFSAGGRYGSGAHAQALASALSDTAGQLAFQNYGEERGNQIRGMLFTPQLAQQDYFDAAKLAEVGSQREVLQQQAIDEARARFDFTQMEPWQRLGLYNQLIQGSYGGQSTTTTTLPRRPIGADILSGASTGAGLGFMFGGPWGAAAGAGLGGLLGLF